MIRLLILLVALSGAAQAGTLDRVRAEGVLHCGSAIRPGLAFPDASGVWHGLNVDICRAVAAAALGPKGRVVFSAYIASRTFDRARTGQDEVSFLTASEMLAENLVGHVLPGPPVFYLATGALVPETSPAQHLVDLAPDNICAEPGTGPERTLTAWFAARHLPLHYFMFQESDEMLDAYLAGRCGAIVQEMPSLAGYRLNAEEAHPSRILSEPFSAVPLMIATGQDDGAWAALVGWTVQTLMRAETLGQPGPGGGAQPLPVAGFGLPPDWQAQVLRVTGSYADIYDRNLGAGSPLELPRGLNRLWTDGGLLCPPFTE
jgi:general L-amino acid transport system substrate-binding protein